MCDWIMSVTSEGGHISGGGGATWTVMNSKKVKYHIIRSSSTHRVWWMIITPTCYLVGRDSKQSINRHLCIRWCDAAATCWCLCRDLPPPYYDYSLRMWYLHNRKRPSTGWTSESTSCSALRRSNLFLFFTKAFLNELPLLVHKVAPRSLNTHEVLLFHLLETKLHLYPNDLKGIQVVYTLCSYLKQVFIQLKPTAEF